MRLSARLVLLFAVLFPAVASDPASAQADDVCAALGTLDRAAADGFVALRVGPEDRAIPPSGGPWSGYDARGLFAGGIAPRVVVPDLAAASYAVQFSGGSDVAFRRLASQIDACGLHASVAEPGSCHRDRGCARAYRLRSGASLHLRYRPAVIDLVFTAPAAAR